MVVSAREEASKLELNHEKGGNAFDAMVATELAGSSLPTPETRWWWIYGL
jgi:gamma-glutamyltranspeptidase